MKRLWKRIKRALGIGRKHFVWFDLERHNCYEIDDSVTGPDGQPYPPIDCVRVALGEKVKIYWASRVDFLQPGLHWSTVNGDRWLLRLSRKKTPMLCFAHGGSEGCEQQNREQGTRCPKCSNR